ncbi:head maturation protease, ClpP-related [Macrococcus armenti]|uniref:head maturation protease, ClpP-related n=1 Tax=Macrococcus armenti TaxID=2875764 RepID=UPI001CD697DE|nr:head maturation protease, ClpP-related [Macrococcus armenti]UBH10600.1 Clp protease ClpP [Macrococcus armenti]
MNKYFKENINIKSELKVMNQSNDVAEIYIYGAIGGWFSETNANTIKQKLEEIKAKTISVFINSPGGDVFDSVAIHNLLVRHDATINVHIDGLAASGASLIAMAGDTITMPVNAQLMIHNAWTFTGGNKHELRKVANDLESIDKSVLATYMKRFKGSKEELQVLLDAETFLDAEQAIALGLADEVVEEVEKEDEEETNVDEDLTSKQNAILQKFSASANKVDSEQTKEQYKNFFDLFKN